MRQGFTQLFAFIPLLLVLVVLQEVSAQGENNHWYFGSSGLRFLPSGPAVINGINLQSEEGCATISDANGNLLFYTDGSTIFNRLHRPMKNGEGLGVIYQYSSTQGALIIKEPGSIARYYVFRIGAYGGYPEALIYVVVDMTLNGGLGEVIGKPRNISPALQLAEKLTGIVHSNGRDTWVVVHGYRDASFFSFLVSPVGVAASPVVTEVGESNQRSQYDFFYAGYMRASPNGTKLVQALSKSTARGTLELFDFNTSTGRLSNPTVLSLNELQEYGVEFSEDGSKLYSSSNHTIYQYDLLAGSTAQVRASRTLIGESYFQNSSNSGGAWALQRGPDNKIYVAQNQNYLGVINEPNKRGTACKYVQRGYLLTGWAMYGLPNFPNQVLNENSVLARIAAQSSCVSSEAQFTGSTMPLVAGATYAWDFGDQASGSTNVAIGSMATHRFSSVGTYLVRLTVSVPGKPPITTTSLVTASPLPEVSLGDAQQQLCAGDMRVLQASSALAASYRWQDGSTGSQYTVRGPGTYSVEVTSAAGCTNRSSVTFSAVPLPSFTLGPDTAICAVEAVKLQPKPLNTSVSYRWQDGSTNASFVATQPGTYWLEMSTSAGCNKRDSVVITAKPCVVMIPNIITPNGDEQNEYFVLKGLSAPEWSLKIYNRWGKEVYNTASYDNKWNAAGQPQGVYFYQLTRRRDGGNYKGWLEVKH